MALSKLFETPTDRLIGITDGVYAIAMTILALELAVPTVTQITSNSALNQYFTTYLFPAIIIYLISFFVVSAYWENSLLLLSFEEVDSFVQNLNFGVLALVCLLPFATGFLFEFVSYTQPNVFFALVNLVISLIYLLMFVHIFKQRVKRFMDEKNIFSIKEAMDKLQKYFKDTVDSEISKEEIKKKYPHFRNHINATMLTLFYLILSPLLVSVVALIISLIYPRICASIYVILIILRLIIKARTKSKFDFKELNTFTPEELELIDKYKEYKRKSDES